MSPIELNTQRINKFLSHYGICSRRKAEILINEKKVLVNGMFAHNGMKVNPSSDRIQVNGKLLEKFKFKSELILLNKPKFVITSCSDTNDRETVIDLLPQKFKKGFFPIGRLDFLSRGALLITNDGDLCYKLSHPKFEHKKTYIVKIKGSIDSESLNKWRSGVYLDDKKTSPCIVNIVNKDFKNTCLKIVMTEGRNRQIRRIANTLGFNVIDLQRISFGAITLGTLKEGHWKIINKEGMIS